MNHTVTDNRKQRLFSDWELPVLLCLLLSFMDFKLYSMHFMIAAFALYWISAVKLRLPKSVVPMLALSVSLMAFWDIAFSGSTTMAKCIVWPGAFLLGYGLIRDSRDLETAVKRALILLGLAALGMFIHYGLNMLVNLGAKAAGRNTMDFWSGERRAATGQAAIACIPVGWFMGRLFCANSWRERALPILGLAVVLYYNLTLSARFLLFLPLVLVAVGVLWTLITKVDRRKKKRVLLSIAVIAVAVLVLYATNTWGIRDTVEDSLLFRRYEVSDNMQLKEDSRWDRRAMYLKLMPRYLWGGNHIREAVGGYAHDLFLDTYDEAGVFALLAVIAIAFDAVAKLFRLLKHPGISQNTKLTVLCVYVAVGAEFLAEPILPGVPWLLASFCLFHGAVTALLHWKAAQPATDSKDGNL